MNFAIDERTKHRLTGLVVILAVAIIFVPAMLKKSNQRLEENIHVSVQLPPKPSIPKVAMTEEKAVFETVKVAKVTLPKAIDAVPASKIARIENLTAKPTTAPLVEMISKPAAKPSAKSIDKQTSPVFIKAQKDTPFNPKPVLLKSSATETYTVQLAAFTVQENAEKLVEKLRTEGYKAGYYTVTSEEGPSYKVTVGQLDDRADARLLKNKLIESTNIEGFIVKRDVG
ncbi:MAG: SPOR domain-containing protein [Gammaproteobacteria bacterium]|nr:SPOR domain-containing protein [Gammaproteobacteria bacterium]